MVGIRRRWGEAQTFVEVGGVIIESVDQEQPDPDPVRRGQRREDRVSNQQTAEADTLGPPVDGQAAQ